MAGGEFSREGSKILAHGKDSTGMGQGAGGVVILRGRPKIVEYANQGSAREPGKIARQGVFAFMQVAYDTITGVEAEFSDQVLRLLVSIYAFGKRQPGAFRKMAGVARWNLDVLKWIIGGGRAQGQAGHIHLGL